MEHINDTVKKRIERLKMLILDVDGVLTNGQIYFSDSGNELKAFDVTDGLGMKMLMKSGITIAVITARNSDSVRHRIENLGIEQYYPGSLNKAEVYDKLKKDFGITNDEAAYVGDDIIDLPVMNQVGVSCAVNNAQPLVKKAADIQLSKSGGYGAVRELCDLILQVQGKWDSMYAPFISKKL